MGSDVPLLFYHNVVTYAVKYGVRSHHNIVTTDSERWHVQLIPFSKKSYRSRIVVQDQKFQKKNRDLYTGKYGMHAQPSLTADGVPTKFSNLSNYLSKKEPTKGVSIIASTSPKQARLPRLSDRTRELVQELQ